MLPYPIDKYLPEIWRLNQTDPKYTAFVNKMNSLILAWRTSILGLYFLKDPVRCPELLLDELMYYLGVEILTTDTENTKRHKAYNAISAQSTRGLWADWTHSITYAKAIIDAITGLDGRIVHWWDSDADDWIMCGDGIVESGWSKLAILGGTGSDPFGFWEVGFGTEIVIPGNIYINCHYGINVSTLTPTQIANIVAAFQFEIAPAYFILYLGYIDVSGNFQVYANGIIS